MANARTSKNLRNNSKSAMKKTSAGRKTRVARSSQSVRARGRRRKRALV